MQNILSSFEDNLNVAVIGVTGGIGAAFLSQLNALDNVKTIYGFSRTRPNNLPDKIKWSEIDITNEASMATAVKKMDDVKFDIIINATGILSVGETSPERSFNDIDIKNFEKIFAVNTHGAALVMKYFLPYLNRDRKSVYANLSARVGSISDNRLGGWYAYRASKAALNMLIKTASIEVARKNKKASVIGLHPGTVDTNLSKPFQANVPDDKLFTPDFSTEMLLKVINDVTPPNSGKCFDWQGEIIQP